MNDLEAQLNANAPVPSQFSETYSLPKTIRSLMTPESPTIALTNPSQSLNALSGLVVMSWHSMPTKTSSVLEKTLWNKSFFVLALNRWLKTHDGEIDDSTMLLFHLSSIVLNTKMIDIHSLVHNLLRNGAMPAIPEAISQWHHSDHGKIAALHAGELIQAAQRIVLSQRPKANTKFTFANEGFPPSALGEGPHSAICVYLAVLVLWTTQAASEPPDWVVAGAAIKRGCNILSQFKLRIAGILKSTLRLLGDKVALEL
ncbi:hypothetical protein BKA65DRAFT_511763 [Rhexocercosporidium sp. MPI-PUGE-AT-0058]|nr:hypothetical protein BKA65DRAFT_511763 [Rhexocercosporidium sp. MPI-PUGE-AT-0058]